MTAGYQALREGAAWLDLAGRGHIRMTGPDRARLAHAMTTQHIEQLQVGQICYAFYLNAQGRILADVNVIATADALLLDTEAATRRLILEHVDRYIIADDVTLEDLSGGTAAIGVEGPSAAALLGALGAPLPDAGHWAPWDHRIAAALSATGLPGVRLFCPAADKAPLIAALEAAGAVAASEQDWKTARLEQARARHGEDFGDGQIPHETQLLGALHFSKGCYLGQEIVERVRSRGHANRQLTHLYIEGEAAPAAGTKVLAGEQEAGEITSSAWSPALGKVAAFAYLRPAAVKGPLSVDGRPAAPSGLKPR